MLISSKDVLLFNILNDNALTPLIIKSIKNAQKMAAKIRFILTIISIYEVCVVCCNAFVEDMILLQNLKKADII